VDSTWREILWQQFGGAIAMLENAVKACPEELWSDRSEQPEYWYMVYHTLFFLDLYLSGSAEGFSPPAPYNLDELDPSGILPERVYRKDELLSYLEHCRAKCRQVIEGLTNERATERCKFTWIEMSFAELLLSNLRHVQHHAAQLNLILRQKIDSAPGWVASVRT
jgi:hypothetical protein